MPTLMKNEYLMGHDRFGAHLLNSKFKTLGVETKKKKIRALARAPKLVCENADVTVLWNQWHTDREVMVNRSDITIKPKEVSKRKTTCIVIDMAIPADAGMSGKRCR